MKYQFFAHAGARTRDPGLIRPMLYRLSYASKNSLHSGGFEPPKLYASLTTRERMHIVVFHNINNAIFMLIYKLFTDLK